MSNSRLAGAAGSRFNPEKPPDGLLFTPPQPVNKASYCCITPPSPLNLAVYIDCSFFTSHLPIFTAWSVVFSLLAANVIAYGDPQHLLRLSLSTSVYA